MDLENSLEIDFKKEPEMVLTSDVLNAYFENSEFLNLRQRRIKRYVDFLQGKYLEETKRRYSPLSMKERHRMPAETWSGNAELMFFPHGDLEFSWYINIDNPGSSPGNCRFLLRVEGKQYALILDQLPSELIEPVYEMLPGLTSLIGRADKKVSAAIEDEIHSFLR